MKIDSNLLRQYLLDIRAVRPEDLKQASRESQALNRELGEVLVQKELIEEQELREAYAHLLDIPWIDLERQEIPGEVLRIIPEAVAKKHQVAAFDKTGNQLKVAFTEPAKSAQVVKFIRKKTGLQVVPYLTSPEQLGEVLERYRKNLTNNFEESIARYAQQISSQDSLEKVAQELPVIKVLNGLIEHALDQLASDVHLEPTEEGVRVRYRIDGKLHEVLTLPRVILEPLSARIKLLANLDIQIDNSAQSGHLSLEEEGVDFKVTVLPVLGGEKVVLRLLNEISRGFTLEKLGFEGEALERIHQAINSTRGMILVIGPGGSGKTTTLYTLLDILNSNQISIATIEDPIECRLKGVNQTAANTRVGLGFSPALEALLLQDPDVILIGELRESRATQLALNASLSGKLVLAGLSEGGITAAEGLIQLLKRGAEPFLVSSAVEVVIAQRLVRKICPNCKTARVLDPGFLEKWKEELDLAAMLTSIRLHFPGEFSQLKESKDLLERNFYQGHGCKQCHGEGYQGQVAISEVLKKSESLEALVARGASEKEIENQAQKEGMLTLQETGLVRVLRGETSLEEVFRVTQG